MSVYLVQMHRCHDQGNLWGMVLIARELFRTMLLFSHGLVGHARSFCRHVSLRSSFTLFTFIYSQCLYMHVLSSLVQACSKKCEIITSASLIHYHCSVASMQHQYLLYTLWRMMFLRVQKSFCRCNNTWVSCKYHLRTMNRALCPGVSGASIIVDREVHGSYVAAMVRHLCAIPRASRWCLQRGCGTC